MITNATFEFLPQFKRQETTKSGGELTQEYIIQAFAKEPEILFLDEPTTHLDTGHIEWLEKKLKNWQGAFVLVSHDRVFLDALCTTIWEIDEGKIKTYKGNYSDYVRQKELEREQQLQAYEKYAKKKRQLEEALRIKAKKAERATKTPKKTNRSEAKIGQTLLCQKTKETAEGQKSHGNPAGKIGESGKAERNPAGQDEFASSGIFEGESGDPGARCFRNGGKKLLWKPARFDVRGGDKLAVIGPNGAGKTTLIQKIIRQDDGITISPSVKIGYFSQNLNILDLKNRFWKMSVPPPSRMKR